MQLYISHVQRSDGSKIPEIPKAFLRYYTPAPQHVLLRWNIQHVRIGCLIDTCIERRRREILYGIKADTFLASPCRNTIVVVA